MAKEAWGNDIDMLIGSCSNETISMLFKIFRSGDLEKRLKNFPYALPPELNVKFGSDKSLEYGKKIKEVYYGRTEPSKMHLQGFLNVSKTQVKQQQKHGFPIFSGIQTWFSGSEYNDQFS